MHKRLIQTANCEALLKLWVPHFVVHCIHTHKKNTQEDGKYFPKSQPTKMQIIIIIHHKWRWSPPLPPQIFDVIFIEQYYNVCAGEVGSTNSSIHTIGWVIKITFALANNYHTWRQQNNNVVPIHIYYREMYHQQLRTMLNE